MSEGRLFIQIDQILVAEDRLRPVDEGAALALSRLIQQEGQKSPIAVYRSNASGKPYTLIYGARRLRALEILGAVEIEAVLRTKAEARMLEITDNLVMPALDALEQAEYVTAYRHWWETEFGPVEWGGNRAKRNDFALNSNFELSEKPNFYIDIRDKFALSERTAQYLFKIGRLSPTLRDALRGTSYAKDQSCLKKLTKYDLDQQAGIAAAFKVNPDLDAVLRQDDPETGREGKGRLDTPEWQEQHLIEHLNRMPPELRQAALSRYGFMPKPINPMPSHIAPVRVVLPSAERSPLMRAISNDPYTHLSAKLSYEQMMKAIADSKEDDRFTEDHAERTARSIRLADYAKHEELEEQAKKAKLKKERKRLKTTGKTSLFTADDTNKRAQLSVPLQRRLGDIKLDTAPTVVRACHKLDEYRQAHMLTMLYKGCKIGVAVDCAKALLDDQRSKPRGVARQMITEPLLLIPRGPYKDLLPQLVTRFVASYGPKESPKPFSKLSPEQQLKICHLIDAGCAKVELDAAMLQMKGPLEDNWQLSAALHSGKFTQAQLDRVASILNPI